MTQVEEPPSKPDPPPLPVSFDLSDERTPTDLTIAPHEPRSQVDILLHELRSHAKRLAELEQRIQTLEELIGEGGVDRVVRQFARLRRYLATWLSED